MQTSELPADPDIPRTPAPPSAHHTVGREAVVPGTRTSFRGGSIAVANQTESASNNLPDEAARSLLPEVASSGQKDGRQNKQQVSLQIPSQGGATRQPVETSIWDWDTPLDSVSESTAFLYEPQGELLHEHRDQGQAKHEFNIPRPLSGTSASNIHWPFPSSTVPSSGSEDFAVPSRPSGAPPSLAGSKRKSTSDRNRPGSAKQHEPKRIPSITSEAGDEPRSPAHNTRSQSGPSIGQRAATETSEIRPAITDMEPSRPSSSTSTPRRSLAGPPAPTLLPARKVFPIQIGDKLFRLSGASISSDAPSYFSQFFEEQLRQNDGADSLRTLYIDRDPATFEDISLHLQGYHIEPRDGPHFVKLFADAQFFSLPRLTAQLYSSTIYIRIGEEEFQIPRDLFSNPGDSPNYFSLGFSVFFTSPNETLPGIAQRGILRPPSILPPSVPNRSSKTFADLLHVLKGYPLEIRGEEHREELLRDARYFHLKGLEQRLIPHDMSYNLARKTSEIMVRLGDIRQSGVSFVADSAGQGSEAPSPASSSTSSTPSGPGWVYYQRPYVDSEAYSLIIEVNGEESCFLELGPRSSSSPARLGRATFYKQSLARITSLFSVIANKMNLPITQPLGLLMMERGAGMASLPLNPGNSGLSEDRVKVRIAGDADVTVDGRKWIIGENDEEDDDEDSGMDIDVLEPSSSRTAIAAGGGKKRKRTERGDDGEDDDEEETEEEGWVVKKAQWRLRVQPVVGGAGSAQAGGKTGWEVILGAVKIEAYSSERARNVARGFLV